ncbi:hypothetical protein [Burkholderia ubonensis]|uniref:hypothetical protein n=1 Tax=Burkholderia ubonensis TaxID=101571 RepID=UPI000759AAF2|nr:hypothetical protein [Burkholderia ubonensis]KWK82316.1 hypothetical protein WM17_17740 [Burkholderia ubonensis]KWK95397.1 hypothetical protein WM18_12755 [Burkholderia ubonensis]
MSKCQNIYERFHTPSDEVAAREVVAMSDEEHARAKSAATVHVRSWLAILLAPVAVGPWVPMFAYMLGMLAYRGMVDPAFDMDRAVGETAVTAIWVTALFIAAWIGLNWCIATYGARQRYWREMPFNGNVELERHTLRSAIVVWSDDYDPEPLYVEEWIDGKLKSSRAGVRQWILARTSVGHWLVLDHRIAADSWCGPPTFPLETKRLIPGRELAIAFAPRTNIRVGLRLSGPAAPLTVTSYLLSHSECQRLAKAAHHYVFFPPDQYGVVDPSDADWVGELAARALEREVPVDVAAGRALT